MIGGVQAGAGYAIQNRPELKNPGETFALMGLMILIVTISYVLWRRYL